MYNGNKEFYEKDPEDMTEQEAKQAVMYWRGKFEGTDSYHRLESRLSFLEDRINSQSKNET